MIKPIYNCFKKGLFIAADSFAMLFQYPILFSYYAILLISYCVIFVIVYNIVGYHTAFAPLADQFQIPDQNLLCSMLPHAGGTVYISLLFSIFLNIFFRNYFDAALIKHVDSIIKNEPISIKKTLTYARHKLWILLQWTAVVSSATIITYLISKIICSPIKSLPIITLTTCAWSVITFFTLPIITLEQKNIWLAIQSSISHMVRTFTKVCGGAFWIMLMYAMGMATLLIIEIIIPIPYLILLGLFCVNGIISSVIIIFKTKMYDLYPIMEHGPANHTPPDFTQF
jgi:hypothetical protein